MITDRVNRELLEALLDRNLSDDQGVELRKHFNDEDIKRFRDGDDAVRQVMIDATKRRIDNIDRIELSSEIAEKVAADTEKRRKSRQLSRRVLILGLSVVSIAIAAAMFFSPEWIATLGGAESVGVLPLTAAAVMGFALIVAVLLEWRS